LSIWVSQSQQIYLVQQHSTLQAMDCDGFPFLKHHSQASLAMALQTMTGDKSIQILDILPNKKYNYQNDTTSFTAKSTASTYLLALKLHNVDPT